MSLRAACPRRELLGGELAAWTQALWPRLFPADITLGWALSLGPG